VDVIVNAVAVKVKASGLIPDKANCWSYYSNQIRCVRKKGMEEGR
jgi:hypothetical protein